MDQDQMKIDPAILEFFIACIERYSLSQKEVMTKYISRMKALHEDWDDPKGYVEMIHNLDLISQRSNQVFEQIRVTYKKFYFDEIIDINKNLTSIKM